MTSKENSIEAFAPGDILVGATVLNSETDDHAGEGRIIQYDAALKEKGVLWTEGTTHLVGGLRFGPDSTLWAFDSQGHKVLRIDTEGRQMPEIKYADRAFSNINFTPDGNILLGEHLVGDTVKLPPGRPLGTELPKLPDSDRFGDGHVFKFTPEGELLHEYATKTHGGMASFLGVTSATLAPDNKTLVYVSEISPWVCRYDLEIDEQLPDLPALEADSGDLAVNVAYQADGTLLFIKANFQEGFFLQLLDDKGSAIKTHKLEGSGWAALCPTDDNDIVLIGNFFTGQLIKFNTETGETLASTDINVQRSLAGIAQYTG